MANKVYFVSDTFIKQNSIINLNVEPQLINLAIIDSQVLHIQMALGSDLYKKLETLISGGTISNNSNVNYKTLLDDYVVPAVLQWTLFECIPYIRYKIMNKSVAGQSSDNSTPIELEELKYIQAQFSNKAEFYTQRLADYLLAHMTLFPEYTSADSIDDIRPSTTQYFAGMQLDESIDACERFLGLNKNTRDINI
jgi:hypothetical protein